jgi:hypothetical protein
MVATTKFLKINPSKSCQKKGGGNTFLNVVFTEGFCENLRF